jgi:hypothetical protein
LKHCDGDLTRSACPGRTAAILAGANLPVTLKEQKDEENKASSSAMSKLFQGANFDNCVLNQILVIWLITLCQPWKQIKDNILGFLYNYALRGVEIYLQGWAECEAHRFYINLQEKVMKTITVRGLISFYF